MYVGARMEPSSFKSKSKLQLLLCSWACVLATINIRDTWPTPVGYVSLISMLPKVSMFSTGASFI